MSLEDYNSLTETLYLFSTSDNARALMDGIDECETMIKAKKSHECYFYFLQALENQRH